MAINIAVVEWTPRTTSGTEDITSAGFGDVQAAMLIYTHDPVSDATLRADAIYSRGFISWNGTGFDQRCESGASQQNLSGVVQESYRADNSNRALMVLYVNGANAGIGGAAVASSITDGIRLTWTWNNPSNSGGRGFLILFGDRTDVQSHLARVNNIPEGQQQQVVSSGFKPDLWFSSGTRAVLLSGSTTGTPSEHDASTIGAAVRDPSDDTIAQHSLNFSSKRGPYPPQAGVYIQNDTLGRNMNFYGQLFGGQRVSSVSSTTYTINSVSGAGLSGTELNILALKFGSDAVQLDLQTLTTPTVSGLLGLSVPFDPKHLFAFGSRTPAGSGPNNLAFTNTDPSWGVGLSEFNGLVYDSYCHNHIVEASMSVPAARLSFTSNDLLRVRPDTGAEAGEYRMDVVNYQAGTQTLNVNFQAQSGEQDQYILLSIGEPSVQGQSVAPVAVRPAGQTITQPKMIQIDLGVDALVVAPAAQVITQPASVVPEVGVAPALVAPAGQALTEPSAIAIDLGVVAPAVQPPGQVLTQPSVIQIDLGAAPVLTAPSGQTITAPSAIDTTLAATPALVAPAGQTISQPASVKADLPVAPAAVLPGGQTITEPTDVSTAVFALPAAVQPTAQTITQPASVLAEIPASPALTAPSGQTITEPASVKAAIAFAPAAVRPASQTITEPADVSTGLTATPAAVRPTAQVITPPAAVLADVGSSPSLVAPSAQVLTAPASVTTGSTVPADLSGLDKKLQVILAKVIRRHT